MYLSIKYLNALASAGSYLLSSVAHSSIICGMPPAISIELTNYCNLRCPECPSGSGIMKRQRGFMDISFFREIIHELKPYLFNTNLYFQGEPMLHPSFNDFIDELKGMHTIVSTNGHFINSDIARKMVSSGLKKIIISLDGPDQETYSKYRINGDVNKVIEGIRLMSEAKRAVSSEMRLEIQMLVNRYNENKIPGIRKIAKEAGAMLTLKSMQVYNTGRAGEWMPSDKRYCRYHIKDGSYKIKGSLPGRCARLWFNPVITWDMKVVPCCFDKDAEYVMGDLKTDSFRNIWHGKEFYGFRNTVLKERGKIPICRNCTSGIGNVKT